MSGPKTVEIAGQKRGKYWRFCPNRATIQQQRKIAPTFTMTRVSTQSKRKFNSTKMPIFGLKTWHWKYAGFVLDCHKPLMRILFGRIAPESRLLIVSEVRKRGKNGEILQPVDMPTIQALQLTLALVAVRWSHTQIDRHRLHKHSRMQVNGIGKANSILYNDAVYEHRQARANATLIIENVAAHWQEFLEIVFQNLAN
ncbi:MAG TPA: hypothetical protein VFE62_26950 [Gemmataceae bacterium]|nr:hypothetical protein [Gemmataceae bacterium]